jgi:molybdate transport system substrate-binding protein
MSHAEALADLRGERALPFANNSMCALVGPSLTTTPDTLLDDMLRPDLRLGMSTPGSDPSGDYALEVFERAETVRAGSAAALRGLANCLTGASLPITADVAAPYADIMRREDADIFLTYRSNALAVLDEVRGTRIVDLPDALAVRATYGCVRLSPHPDAVAFATLLGSDQGRHILGNHGLESATL